MWPISEFLYPLSNVFYKVGMLILGTESSESG